jgi:hypothetical protein
MNANKHEFWNPFLWFVFIRVDSRLIPWFYLR